MLEGLQTLNDILQDSSYFVELDDANTLMISFKYEHESDIDNFISTIIGIKQISCNSITIITSNTQPPLNSQINKSNNMQEIRGYLLEHINKHIRIMSSNIRYKLKIDKKELISHENNLKWFYDSSYILKILRDPLNNISLINEVLILDKKNTVILLNNDIFLKNRYWLISNINRFTNDIEASMSELNVLNEKYSLRKSNCNIEFELGVLIPDIFIFDFDDNQSIYTDELYTILNNIVAMLFIMFIGTYSSYCNGIVNTKITGNKTVELEYSIENLGIRKEHYKVIKEIYYLSYNSLSVENIFLVRNMVGVYLCDQCNVNTLDLLFQKAQIILDSSKENLNILTIGNVEKYFSTRYSLFEFLDKSTSDIHKQIQDLIDKMNKIYLSTIATLVATSFVYLKDRNLNIFKLGILIYTVYLIIDGIFTFTFNRKVFNDLINSYSKKLEYFKPIVGVDHYNKITSDNNTTKKLKKRFYWYYITSLSIYIIMIVTGIFTFLNTEYVLNLLKYIIKVFT